MAPSRVRRAAHFFKWASAAWVVSTPSRFQAKPSRRIWDRRGFRPGPYLRSISSTQ